MVRLSACLKAVTALTVEMTHKEQNRFIPTEPGTFIEIIRPSSIVTYQETEYFETIFCSRVFYIS